MQHNAADELHPVGPQAQHPVRRLPDGGKGFGQNIIRGFPVLQPLLELGGLRLELGIGESLVLLLQRLNFVGDGIDLLQLMVTVCTENFGKQTHIKKTSFPCSQCLQIDYQVYHIFPTYANIYPPAQAFFGI